MTDSWSALDYGERLVLRYRASGLTRKGYAAQEGISVSALDYYVRRERGASLRAGLAVNRILPVELMAAETGASGSAADTLSGGSATSALSGGIQPVMPSGGVAVRLVNDRFVEVRRGFDAELLREVVAALEARGVGERA